MNPLVRQALPFLLASISLLCAPLARAGDLAALWQERVACTVAIEYYVETETERRESTAYGTVVDDQGTVVLPASAINLRFSPSQLKGFKLYTPGDLAGTPCEYLGVDALTGWHFVRAAEAVRPKLKPVTRFARIGAKAPGVTEEVWGIGLRGKDEDFIPYFLSARVALVNALPQRTGVAQHEVTAPGLPVFDAEGNFVGIGLSSFGQSFIEFSRTDRGGSPVMLVNIEESSAFLLANEVLPYIGRIPGNQYGRPLAWLGAYGLEPVDPEVARFLKLENQSAAIVSEVLEGSPAEAAGLKERDVIVALNGKTLPRFKPDRAVTTFIDEEVNRSRPGDELSLTVLRDGKQLEIKTKLADMPKLAREARRQYFDHVGVSAREFVFSDAVVRRIKVAESLGVIAHFVKPSGPANAAGLMADDWIREIDGTEVKTYEQAVEKLAGIEKDAARSEFVMLVSRNGETSVLRVKLK